MTPVSSSRTAQIELFGLAVAAPWPHPIHLPLFGMTWMVDAKTIVTVLMVGIDFFRERAA